MKAFSGFKRKEIFNLGLFSISLVPLILFAFVVYQRLNFPFDLEWGEGAGINQIYFMLSGKQLYGPPTIDFAPLVYTPFYYWLSSLLSSIFQEITLPARIISVLSSLGVAGLIAWVVIKDTGNRLAGWLSSSVYLACYALSDGFYDLVRVDSLYVLLLLISFLILREEPKPVRMAAAGITIALGFYTKQSTLIVFFPLIVYCLAKYWKYAWPLLLTVLVGVVGPFLWINARTDGWFSYYVLRLPREHGYSLVAGVDFWIGDLLGPLGIAIGFGMLFLLFKFIKILSSDLSPGDGKSHAEDEKKPGNLKLRLVCDLLFAAGAIGSAWITRASNGGGANNVMSAYAAVAILFGLGFSFALQLVDGTKVHGDKYRLLVYSLAAIQLIGLIYNPFNFIPAPAEVDANNALVARIEETEGPVWIPYRSHLPLLVDKDGFIHAVNLFELTGYFKGDVLPEGSDLVKQIREEICNQSFEIIVIDQRMPWIEMQLNNAYQVDASLAISDEARRSTQLRWQGGFDALYVPRDDYDLDGCLNSVDQAGEG